MVIIIVFFRYKVVFCIFLKLGDFLVFVYFWFKVIVKSFYGLEVKEKFWDFKGMVGFVRGMSLEFKDSVR